MKRILTLLIAGAMIFSLSACGKDEKDSVTDDKISVEDGFGKDIPKGHEDVELVSGVNDSAENVAKTFYEILYDENSSYEDLKKFIAPHDEYLDDLDEDFFEESREEMGKIDDFSIEITNCSNNYAEETIDDYANNLKENGYILEELNGVRLNITVNDADAEGKVIPKSISAVKIDGRWYVGVEYYIDNETI